MRQTAVKGGSLFSRNYAEMDWAVELIQGVFYGEYGEYCEQGDE
jgi:hypothetical protein